VIALRAALFWCCWAAWTVGLGTVGLPVFLPIFRKHRRTAVAISKLWASGSLCLMRVFLGLRHEVRGVEHKPAGPAIFALKHQSAWETIALACLLDDPAIVLKRELLSIPFFGWYLARVGMIAIDRMAGAGALKQMVAQARTAVAQGRPIAIFPEGTRGRIGEKLPYHPGVGALYTQLGLPLVPVALNSGLYWRKGFFDKAPGVIIIEFLPNLAPGADRRETIAQLETRIETATQRLVETPRTMQDRRAYI